MVIKNRDDIRIERRNGQIIQTAKTETGVRELANERRMLDSLDKTPYVPRVYEVDQGKLIIEDVGDSGRIFNDDRFFLNFINMLDAFRVLGINHGDLTSGNIRVVDDVPKVIDWKESHFVFERVPDKRPEGDIYHAFDFLAHTNDPRRIGRRFFAMWCGLGVHRSQDRPYRTFGKERWLDIGCYTGAIAACAAVSGFDVHAIDISGQSIKKANDQFGHLSIDFQVADAPLLTTRIAVNVATCLSTYPYILQQHGELEAHHFVERLVTGSDVLFFETQLYGDGPGPIEFQAIEDVIGWMYDRGAYEVEPICEIPLSDRNRVRTVLKVT